MNKSIILSAFVASAIIFSCNLNSEKAGIAEDSSQDSIQIVALLDSFNLAAAEAKYEQYFSYYTDDAVFIGTDATEYWNKAQFMIWAKPFFDKKRTWNFTAVQRNIYFGKSLNFAWFDELLSTQMKICRGSGVLVKQGPTWRVQQYVLSTTIPNSLIDSVVVLKSPEEDALLKHLQK